MSILEIFIKLFPTAVTLAIIKWFTSGIRPFEINKISLNLKIKFIEDKIKKTQTMPDLQTILRTERQRLIMKQITNFDNPLLQKEILYVSSNSPDIPGPGYLAKFKHLLTINEEGFLSFSNEKISEYNKNFFVTYLSGYLILIPNLFYEEKDMLILNASIILTITIHLFSLTYITPVKRMRKKIEERILRAYNLKETK